MKAYVINGTELYAAENYLEAASLHRELHGDDGEVVEIAPADLAAPWIDEEKGRRTVGDALAEATKPGWMGSTEVH